MAHYHTNPVGATTRWRTVFRGFSLQGRRSGRPRKTAASLQITPPCHGNEVATDLAPACEPLRCRAAGQWINDWSSMTGILWGRAHSP